MMCELRNFGDAIPCGQGLHKHHLIPRAALRNSKEARKYVDSTPDVFLADLCPAHHLYGTAHKRDARAYLILVRCADLGVDYVREKINGVPWKIETPEYSFEGMIAGTPHEDAIDDLSQAP